MCAHVWGLLSCLIFVFIKFRTSGTIYSSIPICLPSSKADICNLPKTLLRSLRVNSPHIPFPLLQPRGSLLLPVRGHYLLSYARLTQKILHFWDGVSSSRRPIGSWFHLYFFTSSKFLSSSVHITAASPQPWMPASPLSPIWEFPWAYFPLVMFPFSLLQDLR